MIGIYKIENIETNNIYIGQSKNILKRWEQHKEQLKNNIHHQNNLQSEYNNYKDIIKEQYKSNELFNYLNYDNITIDKYYKFETIKEYDNYNLNELLFAEDEYILKQRDIKEGYKQLTNKEINNIFDKLDISEQVEFIKLNYPNFYNDLIIGIDEDITNIKNLYLNNKIELMQLIKQCFNIGNEFTKEYIRTNKLK